MTLHKLHAGDGYTYLTRQVAAGDERRSPGQQLTDYYLASGNPPGRWMGSGAADLGITGTVREDQMRSLFGRGLHPDAEQIMALEQAAGTPTDTAAQTAKLGRAFPQYQPLAPRAERVAARLAAFEVEHGHPPSAIVRSKIQAQEARRERRPVAGYDLVFTPVKSASLLWSLGSAATRQAVEDAHHEAVANTLAWLEAETALARVGDRGEQQIETRGFLATGFDHRDSRAGDPDLHTHLAISNKVRAVDDYPDGRPRWLSLDARPLHNAAVAASERYNTRFEDALSSRLGVRFVERPSSCRSDKRPVREITGVPEQLIRHFSKRRAAIEARYTELLTDYRHTHGHSPTTAAQLHLAQQATLETRSAKALGPSFADKLTAWRHEAATVLGEQALDGLSTEATRQPAPDIPERTLEQVAAAVIDVVSHEKATFTRWNVIAETERQLRGHRFATPADREATTRAVVEAGLSPTCSVQLTATGLEATAPEGHDLAVRRSSGEDVLIPHGVARYTTQDVLDAEQRLLDHTQQPTRYGLSAAQVDGFLACFEERNDLALDCGQRRLVHAFTTNGRRLVVGIGPAGSGKTTAMRALTQAWRTTGHRVIPLAPSAAAADVLRDELGCRTENLHKFHHAHTNAPAGGQSQRDEWFQLQPGDLVLVDEAGMAGTRHLDWLTSYARDRGAVVRLLGDPAQLSSVEAGGALRLLADDTDAIELTDLHRFHDPVEAEATLAIRDGRADGIEFYATHDRIRSGGRHELLEQALTAWRTDQSAGLDTLLIAASAGDVAALNTRARAARVRAGAVEDQGIELADGTTAGVGDTVVTRRNDRRLTTADARHFVKNGDTWTVHRRHPNGDLSLLRADRADRAGIRVPNDYVVKHLELGYATTATRGQGRTVDTAHAFIDRGYTRETLYVALTRARRSTTLFVATDEAIALDAERPPSPASEATDILASLTARQPAQLAATQVARQSDLTSVRRHYSEPRIRSTPHAERTRCAQLA